VPSQLKLSELIAEIAEAIDYRFVGETFWITAEITDVKKMVDKRWCFLKFIEKQGNFIVAEMKAVFWSNTFHIVEEFEKITKQNFANGLEITCEVKVRFHARYGLDVEIIAIDHSYTIGKIILEKEKTLLQLITDHPNEIKCVDGEYFTLNQHLPLPIVMQRIALITAPNSDGQRDFVQEITNNAYGYAFNITLHACTVQGENAVSNMLEALAKIAINIKHYDAVAIVRGGGSQLDLAPFDHYNLAVAVAKFPIPIFTGIGHDSNTSIVDLMARQLKTPTKVAANFIDNNFYFENEIMQFQEKILQAAKQKITNAQYQLMHFKQTLKAYHPQTILAKGYAIIYKNDKVISNAKDIEIEDTITIQMQHQSFNAKVYEKK
jgi:exodeoxyribonuclease VII large subunit